MSRTEIALSQAPTGLKMNQREEQEVALLDSWYGKLANDFLIEGDIFLGVRSWEDLLVLIGLFTEGPFIINHHR